MNTKPILVTGGTGLVGSYVIRDLVRAGYAVKALRRNKRVPFYIDRAILDRVQWVEGDIMNPALLNDEMNGAGAVIHCAASVSFKDTDQSSMRNINIEGTANVVNAAIENTVSRFVHVSSVAAFGRSSNIVVNEKQVWQESKQNTNYAVSKFHGEMEVWRGIAEGLPAVIVNPSTVLGYGDWNTSSSALFKNAFQGFRWYTNGINGFVDVEDVSRAILALMKSDISGERYILNGENWSYKQLLDALADGFGKQRPSVLATPLLAGIAWRLEKLKTLFTGRSALITRESAKVARGHTEYDNSKILHALPGFRFKAIRDTIVEACANYTRNLQA